MIKDYHFGRMMIEERNYTHDLKILRGEVISDWWRKEGHTVEVEDVADLLSAKPKILVVGMGQPGRMQVSENLKSILGKAGILLIEQPTAEAMRTFNSLQSEGESVAAAFHLTC